MRAVDSRRDFTPKKVFPGYFSELSEKANSGLVGVFFVCGPGALPSVLGFRFVFGVLGVCPSLHRIAYRN